MRYFYSFFGTKSATITKEISNNNGHILVFQANIDDEIYLLVNFYNSNIGRSNSKPYMNLLTVGKFLELKDKFDLCEVWRLKHPSKSKTFSFGKKYFSSFIQRRLD